MASTYSELQERYQVLTARIRAVDADVAKALDAQTQQVLRERRGELEAERDRVSAEMDALAIDVGRVQRQANGDLDELRRKIDRLGRVLARDDPDTAHEVILECVDALGRIDQRIGGLETRVTVIERRIDPPVQVRLWQLAAMLVVVLGGVFFMVPPNRDLLMVEHPWFGVVVLVVISMLAGSFWRLAQLTGRGTFQ